MNSIDATAPDTRSFAMIRTLGAIALISGLLVVLVFEWTKPLIEANKRELIERAVFQVIPGTTQRRDFLVGEDGVKPAGETRGNGIIIYAAYDDAGALKGIAAEAAAQGYQDVIRLLYGYSPECQCITGIRVLKLSETPGLGDKIITDAAFVANFNALEARLNDSMGALANAIVTVKHGTKHNPWEIDAISGATISSKAVGKALNDSTQRLLPLLVPRFEQLKKAEPQRTQRVTKEKRANAKSASNDSTQAQQVTSLVNKPLNASITKPFVSFGPLVASEELKKAEPQRTQRDTKEKRENVKSVFAGYTETQTVGAQLKNLHESEITSFAPFASLAVNAFEGES